MPWYVYALIGWHIFMLSAYLVYAVERRSIEVTVGTWLCSLILSAFEMWALVHLALHAH